MMKYSLKEFNRLMEIALPFKEYRESMYPPERMKVAILRDWEMNCWSSEEKEYIRSIMNTLYTEGSLEFERDNG